MALRSFDTDNAGLQSLDDDFGTVTTPRVGGPVMDDRFDDAIDLDRFDDSNDFDRFDDVTGRFAPGLDRFGDTGTRDNDGFGLLDDPFDVGLLPDGGIPDLSDRRIFADVFGPGRFGLDLDADGQIQAQEVRFTSVDAALGAEFGLGLIALGGDRIASLAWRDRVDLDQLDPGASNGDDRRFGSGDDDTLAGLEGDDRLVTGSGQDLLIGGAGRDTLRAGGGADLADGGLDNDLLVGGGGDDTLIGGGGRDRLLGGSGDDVLIGGAMDLDARGRLGLGVDLRDDPALARSTRSLIRAGSGDDLVIGSSGSDRVMTGSGDDTVVTGRGTDTIFTGRGEARIDLGRDDDNDRVILDARSDVVLIANFDARDDLLDLRALELELADRTQVLDALEFGGDAARLDLGDTTIQLQGLQLQGATRAELLESTAWLLIQARAAGRLLIQARAAGRPAGGVPGRLSAEPLDLTTGCPGGWRPWPRASAAPAGW